MIVDMRDWCLLLPLIPEPNRLRKLHVQDRTRERSSWPRSAEYDEVQERLARGWNTWDVHSVATQVLLPEGLAIHVGMKHNTSLNGDAFLGDALIGRLEPGAEVVTPGPHAWDGSYTSADFEWKGHKWRWRRAHDGEDLVMLVTPCLEAAVRRLPPTVVVQCELSLGQTGNSGDRNGRCDSDAQRRGNNSDLLHVRQSAKAERISLPVGEPYFAADLTVPIAISTRKRTSLNEINEIIQRAFTLYGASSQHPKANSIRSAMRLRRRLGGTRFMSQGRRG